MLQPSTQVDYPSSHENCAFRCGGPTYCLLSSLGVELGETEGAHQLSLILLKLRSVAVPEESLLHTVERLLILKLLIKACQPPKLLLGELSVSGAG